MVENSDKTWSTAEGNGKPLQYCCLKKTMNSMKRQKDMLPEDEPLRSVGVQYATGEEQRNSSRKTKEAGQSRNDTQLWMCLVVNKVQCYKEQYCIETRNVRSMNQGTLDVIKQEMARVNTDILGISELTWMGMGKFNSDDYYIYYCGQEFFRRNGMEPT